MATVDFGKTKLTLDWPVFTKRRGEPYICLMELPDDEKLIIPLQQALMTSLSPSPMGIEDKNYKIYSGTLHASFAEILKNGE